MRLFIAATAALITTSGIGVGTALHTSGSHAQADLCLSPTNVAAICVSHLCVSFDLNGGSLVPISKQCPPTPLPNDCNLNVPPSVSDIVACEPVVGTVGI